MRSRKAQCEAAPDNSEAGNITAVEEESCADEKIEDQNAYKRCSHHPSATTTTTNHHAWYQGSKQHIFDGTCASMSVSCCCCCRSVLLLLYNDNPPPPNEVRAIEGRGVAQFPPSWQLAGRVVHVCVFWPRGRGLWVNIPHIPTNRDYF